MRERKPSEQEKEPSKSVPMFENNLRQIPITYGRIQISTIFWRPAWPIWTDLKTGSSTNIVLPMIGLFT